MKKLKEKICPLIIIVVGLSVILCLYAWPIAEFIVSLFGMKEGNL